MTQASLIRRRLIKLKIRARVRNWDVVRNPGSLSGSLAFVSCSFSFFFPVSSSSCTPAFPACSSLYAVCQPPGSVWSFSSRGIQLPVPDCQVWGSWLAQVMVAHPGRDGRSMVPAWQWGPTQGIIWAVRRRGAGPVLGRKGIASGHHKSVCSLYVYCWRTKGRTRRVKVTGAHKLFNSWWLSKSRWKCVGKYVCKLLITRSTWIEAEWPVKDSSAGNETRLIYLPSNKNLEFLEQVDVTQLSSQRWSRSLEEERPATLGFPWTWGTAVCGCELASGPSHTPVSASLLPDRCTRWEPISKTHFQLRESGTLSCYGSVTWHRAWCIDGAWFLLEAGVYDFGMLTKHGYSIVNYSDCTV